MKLSIEPFISIGMQLPKHRITDDLFSAYIAAGGGEIGVYTAYKAYLGEGSINALTAFFIKKNTGLLSYFISPMGRVCQIQNTTNEFGYYTGYNSTKKSQAEKQLVKDTILIAFASITQGYTEIYTGAK